jgi:cytochrome c5
MHRAALVLLLVAGFALADEMADAKKRWETSPYGPMLERILPPTFEARQLPEPGSEGARLAQRYCVQCHNLPNPAMHHAAKWPAIVDRMVVRMEGRGNMGRLMADMMAGVHAPAPEETQALKTYLQDNAQTPLDPARYPELYRPSGEAFRLACSQCHVLPDPKRHTAAEWPAVVARMQQNMEWMNRIVGSKPDPDEPQLRVDAINAFLKKYAR